VARTASQTRPAELLDGIVSYLVRHGVAELSLRPLAKAVKSSPRVLLYYFGSKERLIVKALTRVREHQRVTFSAMRQAKHDRPSDACRAIWKQMSAPQSEPVFRFFFETYAMALRHPKNYADFLSNAVGDWLEFVAAPLVSKGHSLEDARAFATIVIAGFRGFMLDYCATHDRERTDRAVDLWLNSLDTIRPDLQEAPHVR
jgi:AcrR family transcriptional regulator